MVEEDSSDSDVQSNINDRVLKDPSQDPRSPFFLHPSENPDAVLISPPVNDNNYHNWSRAMR